MKTTFLTAFFLISLMILNSCQKSITDQQPTLASSNSKAASAAQTTSLFKVSSVFSDNMVIQRDKPAAVWGTAPSGHTISIKASWNNNNFTTVANKKNQWLITIPATPVNTTPQQLSVMDDADTVSFNNILIGDVWICSGQSNMVMPVDSVSPPYNGFEGVINYQQEIAAANWPLLRLAQLQTDYQANPVYDLTYPTAWSSCDPSTVGAYSAVAYFFGKKIMTTLNVPVGLVVSAVGGTACQWWTNKQQLQADPTLNAYYSSDWQTSELFNGMINPLRYMSVKGFIWYQGEANRYDRPVSNYTKLNSAMIKGWRNQFGQGALPFYFVQMTPYDVNWDKYSEPRDDDYAFFREAQANVSSITNTGMAVTMDVGDLKRIHPRDKAPVGERLALLALHRTYKLAVKDEGPRYSSYSVNNYTATIKFVASTVTGGLSTKNNDTLGQYFFVAGTDSVFRQGTATISGNKIVVTAPAETPLPILAVRYAFTNYPMPNLQNASGLPMEPFRTDNWSF